MVHFYESSIITTTDGLHCQVYSNEHPSGCIIVKPKYIPVDKIHCDDFQCRYIAGKRMLRLNMWIEQGKLKKYLDEFKKNYPEYIYHGYHDNRLFFCVPLNKIQKVYDPQHGLFELMNMPKESLDEHLKIVVEFVKLLLKSGVALEKIGVTYSTLVGHYFMKYSDINIVIHGKKNFWKIMEFLRTAKDPKLRWKSDDEWRDFHKKRARAKLFSEEDFLFQMKRKNTEGFFNDVLFLIFGVEEPDELWFKWGEEEYVPDSLIKIHATVKDNYNSVVRPGCYDVRDAEIIEYSGSEDKEIVKKKLKKVVFYSRDYVLQALPGETIEASGLLEKVIPKKGDPYYRVVVGYFDSYISERRGKEFIRALR